ncbi:MAG: ABC transporter ATP-binding protein [Planctomycetes bacterium]|nr:ABC transporter ATP-binding protein [Planctomycetota bacterium]
MSKYLRHARGMHKSYRMGRVSVEVLKGTSLDLRNGEFLVVMGASGCGKSTLLHILGGLDTPDRGTLEFDRQDVFTASDAWRRTYRSLSVGFIFQFYHLLPECTVLENVMMPRLVKASAMQWLLGGAKRTARRDASAMLDRVGLAERLQHRPNELSGGERQRVAIARALINGPRLLLADEPTGNLDAAMGEEILRLLVELNRGGQTIVMVTHDPKVASHADRRLHIRAGVIEEAKTRNGARPER